jgi:hypothetical protein
MDLQPTGLVNGQAQAFSSIKLLREESGISATLGSLAYLTPSTRVCTLVSSYGRPAQGEINLGTGVVTLTVWHPGEVSNGVSPLRRARPFNRSFNKSMG